jgi:hypothetical protein
MSFWFDGKMIRKPDHFLKYLRDGGFNAAGVACQANGCGVDPAEGETGDPSALVNAYTNPDYYEITSDLPSVPFPGGGMSYTLEVGSVVTFTITKRSGIDGSIKHDADVVGVHWHGGTAMPLSTTEVTLVNGQATVDVGPAPGHVVGGHLGVVKAGVDHVHAHVRVV